MFRTTFRRLFRLRRPSPQELVPRYDEYLRLQREAYLSHESEVKRWADGQRRFVEAAFGELPRSLRVLDCACGDGIGLDALRSLGCQGSVGVELSPAKASKARERGFRVEEADMHDLSIFEGGSFDAVLCSHTLEHAWDPAKVLSEFRRVLVPEGRLLVVLPYPDTSRRNELAHPAKYVLGTHLDDGGEAVIGFFLERGFVLEWSRRDDVREPEIWLSLRASRARTPGSPDAAG